MARIFFFLFLLSLQFIFFCHGAGQKLYESSVFTGHVKGAKSVYDGDTLQDVRILLDRGTPQGRGEVWPGLFLTSDGIYIETDIRIAGIDTPETRPRKKRRDGRIRSARSLANEKRAAKKARAALVDLLSASDFQVSLTNISRGKYAGRLVADCVIGGIPVASYMINRGHALPYSGGARPELEWDSLDSGLMRPR